MSDNPEALPELPDPHTILRRGDGTLSAVLFTLEQMTDYASTRVRAALAQQAATPLTDDEILRIARRVAEGEHDFTKPVAEQFALGVARGVEAALASRQAATPAPAEPDIADIVAGALQTSRANAYELMRESLATSAEPSAFLIEPTPQAHPALMVDVVRFHPGNRPDWTVTPLYALAAPPATPAGGPR